MLVVDLTTDIGEVVPAIPERMRPALEVLVQVDLADLGIVLEVGACVADLLVAKVLFLDVVEDVGVMLVVEAKEHLGVVQVAVVAHLLAHRIQ